jgi:mannosyltransferase OCH1-like enzyme
MIPKNIFQTHKSKKYICNNQKLHHAVNSWQKHADFNYHFYTDVQCEQFIKDNFDELVYKAYMKVPLAVMKADLWRYCVIYYYGGIYADTDTICKVNPNIFINDSLLTIVPESDKIHLCQWVFAAQKGSPFLKSIIDLSVERILTIKEIKGEHIVHVLTGPGVFTNGIEEYLLKINYPVFTSNRKNYYNYPKPELKVFNCDNFHKNLVIHLFAGSNDDGWKKERGKVLTI